MKSSLFLSFTLLALLISLSEGEKRRIVDVFEHEETADEIRKYWTLERRKNAKERLPLRTEEMKDPLSPDAECSKEYENLTNESHYSEYPFSSVGVLFFELAKVAYQCSASIASGKYIWTAGHCLYDRDTQTYSKKVTFIPGYINGTSAYPQFPLKTTYVPSNWRSTTIENNQSLAFDYSMGELLDNVESSIGSHFDLVVNLVPSDVEYW
eukprot:CAMPEP_0201507074 /NCGR_PEP_ID=MMETSP0161_2-20130828/859_1 /ASSEMBLY_ACC=CAM_ASM_000251 /TAXON_ID=180227 /ORGANISM="Neoparamoeba aestuarina, Strain SoJaBio B1-5/56/2" /LENGTH=209 /DNA_ID=CAMNT_0047901347 /DNA_START=103 /DNA_END=729 /DNA_ORIENTATION=-